MADLYNQEDLQLTDIQLDLDYQKLLNYIQKFLKRYDTDVLKYLPQWISQAQLRLAKDLKNLGSMKVITFQVTPATTSNIPYGVIIEKPARWRQTKSLGIIDNNGGRRYVYARSYEYVRDYIQEFSDPTFEDTRNVLEFRYYSDYDFRNYLLGPYLRTKPYSIELSYFEEILPLSSTNPQNWWTLYAPRALIYAILIEASFFLRSDDRSANYWNNEYQTEIQSLNAEDQGRYLDSSNIRKV